MSSYGMELEICCWESPQDLVPQYEATTTIARDTPQVVNLLEESSPRTPLSYRRPVPVYQEDLHIANFNLLADLGMGNFVVVH
jgi:hypothetical protein